MIPNKKIVRGIAQDYAPIDMPQGAMRTARNIYLNDTLNAVSNEKGFNQLVDFTNNIVGSISIEEDNIVLFSIDSQSVSEVGIYYNNNNTYTPILRSDLLNLQKGKDLKGVFVRNYKKELIISQIPFGIYKPEQVNAVIEIKAGDYIGQKALLHKNFYQHQKERILLYQRYTKGSL